MPRKFCLTPLSTYALMPPVFDAAPAPTEARHPDPTDRAIPPRVGKLLCLLHTFILYGKNLADTLRQHAADPRVLPFFTDIALTFHTVDLTLILARISRGLLRAAALEERLRKRASRGQDLDPDRIRPHRPHNSRPRKKPAARLHDPVRAPSLDTPLTLEQIAAEDRRRPIGAVLVDICLDLGIVPSQMDPALREQLRRAVMDYRGSLSTLYVSRLPDSDPAAIPDDLPIPIDKDGIPIITCPPWPAPAEKPPPLAGGLSREADQCREADRWGRGPGP